MAAKVALTAEEFRENSQRSIALFNTEKLSTDSTHVLKSAYCNSVHFCRCNLHGACGGKAEIQQGTNEVLDVAICTGRVEAKRPLANVIQTESGCNLHGACGGKGLFGLEHRTHRRCNLHGACGGKGEWRGKHSGRAQLQSARGVWRQRCTSISSVLLINRCNLHGACGGKVCSSVLKA